MTHITLKLEGILEDGGTRSIENSYVTIDGLVPGEFIDNKRLGEIVHLAADRLTDRIVRRRKDIDLQCWPDVTLRDKP